MPPVSTTPTSEAALQPRYRTAAAALLIWAEFDGSYVLFHRPSGKTHFLNESSAFLLLQVLQEPRTAEEATEELLTGQVAPIDPSQHQYVRELLRRFGELGIIGH